MSCCDQSTEVKKSFWERQDKVFWTLFAIIAVLYAYAFFDMQFVPIQVFGQYAHTILNYMHQMYWGVILGIIFVVLIQVIPQSVILTLLSSKTNTRSILKATFAGVLLDLCNHGILLVAMKLYKKGVRTSQIIAFLVASPWNSFSLLFILIALIGWEWTLIYLVLSMVVAFSAGLLYEWATQKNILPENPHFVEHEKVGFKDAFRDEFKDINVNGAYILQLFKGAFFESQSIMRWLLIGVFIASALANFIPTSYFQLFFGPTLIGLFSTLVASTAIEVCSEGSVPIANEIFHKGNAPGNAFMFLMAGASTDYMEIMALKESTKSWKIALFLPLFTLPQIIMLSIVLNYF